MRKIHYKKSDRLNRGFTLVETLVAISIFTTSVVALMVVLTQGISNTIYANQKMISSYLAQEGIEYMRNMRDTFVLYNPTNTQAGWNAFNSYVQSGIASCQNADGCYFGDLPGAAFTNPTQPMAGLTLTACGASCPELKYDSATGKYNYTTGTISGFIRKIKIIVVSPNETKIFSTVIWTQGSGIYSINFSESLFNWME